jgi:hypothetical protein
MPPLIKLKTLCSSLNPSHQFKHPNFAPVSDINAPNVSRLYPIPRTLNQFLRTPRNSAKRSVHATKKKTWQRRNRKREGEGARASPPSLPRPRRRRRRPTSPASRARRPRRSFRCRGAAGGAARLPPWMEPRGIAGDRAAQSRDPLSFLVKVQRTGGLRQNRSREVEPWSGESEPRGEGTQAIELELGFWGLIWR